MHHHHVTTTAPPPPPPLVLLLQARDDVHSNWITLELRYDRAYQTFSKAVFAGIHNLCVLCGDAMTIIPTHMPSSVLDNVFVNHPEPPQQVAGKGGSTQGNHLLDEVRASSLTLLPLTLLPPFPSLTFLPPFLHNLCSTVLLLHLCYHYIRRCIHAWYRSMNAFQSPSLITDDDVYTHHVLLWTIIIIVILPGDDPRVEAQRNADHRDRQPVVREAADPTSGRDHK